MPLCRKVGVQSKLAVPSPLSTKAAPAGNDEDVIVGVMPSGSVAVKAKLNDTFSVVVWAPIESRTGGWLPDSPTVMVTTSLSTALEASLAKNLIL